MAGFVKTKQKPQQQADKAKQSARKERAPANPQQIREAPQTLRPDDILAAQQQFGNQAVQRAVEDPGQPDSITDAQGNLRDDISNNIQQARGSGATLPKSVQAETSRRLGHNFDNVRIHTDGRADQLSRDINARAFTIGSDIFFRGGAFAPGTQRGRETLIHELTHVVQQSGSKLSGGRLKLGPRGNALEKQAEQNGRSGASSTTGASAAGAVQKEEIQAESLVQMQPQPGVIQRAKDEEGWDTGEKSGETEEAPEAPQTSLQEHLKTSLQKRRTAMHIDDDEGTSPVSLQDHLKNSLGQRREAMHMDEDDSSPAPETQEKGIPTPPPAPDLAPAKQGGTTSGSFSKDIKAQAKKLTGKPLVIPHQKDSLQDERNGSRVERSNIKGKLVQIIENPDSTTEQAEEAKSKLKTLFGDHKDSIKNADKNRKNNLLKLAQSGDPIALERHKSENTFMGKLTRTATGLFGKAKGLIESNKGTIDKAMPYVKEYGPKVFGAIGSLFGGGGKKKDEAGGGGGATVNVNAGGGGGGGGGAAGMIAELYQENKQLKEQIAKLQQMKPAAEQ
jgi:hypothetical protein